MEKRLGVYIHIPFCASKCGYCDFYSLAGCDQLMPDYERALIRHMEEYRSLFSKYYIDTVYFGGGTPSYFGARRICNILNALKRSGRLLKASEITVEVNPDSIDRRDMKLLRQEGVNRLSIGAQSANDDILRLIGRRHSWKQVEKAVTDARKAGFDNVSVDIIYGLPSQTRNDWADTVTKTLKLHPEHISCYGLKLEEGTPMIRYLNSEILPDDDDQADMYLYTAEKLEQYGYPLYEISNFSLKGYESRHNMKYWTLQDYIGFGPGAHSCVDGLRYSYVRDLRRYMAGLEQGEDILDECEQIDALERAAEYIMLGMRTARGISGEEYHSVYRSDFSTVEAVLREYEKRGWTEKTGDRWHFTYDGYLLSNRLIGEMLEAQAVHKLSGNPWVKENLGSGLRRVRLPEGSISYFK